MRRLLIAIAVLAAPLAGQSSTEACAVSTPYSLGNGVTITQCAAGVGVTGTPGGGSGVSYATGLTVPTAAGNSAVFFGYICEQAASNCGSGGSLRYLFPSSTITGYTAITGATYLYGAGLQDTLLTGTNATPCNTSAAVPAGLNYCNFIWYIPSVPSLGSSVYLNMYCSSTAPPTYTSATDCQFISWFYIEFSGGCTTAGTACSDQTVNNSTTTHNSTSLTVTTGSVAYTHELCLALGGTFNDEALAATNSGTIVLAPNNNNVMYGKPCRAAARRPSGSRGPATTWAE